MVCSTEGRTEPVDVAGAIAWNRMPKATIATNTAMGTHAGTADVPIGSEARIEID